MQFFDLSLVIQDASVCGTRALRDRSAKRVDGAGCRLSSCLGRVQELALQTRGS